MRRRITALATVAALLAVLAFAIPLGLLAGRRYIDDERNELQRSAGAAATETRGELDAGATTGAVSGEVSVGIYNPSGVLVSGTGPARAPAPARHALAGRESSDRLSDRLRAAAPISDGDQVNGAVLVSTSLDVAHQRARHTWLLLAALGAGAVLVTALVALLFSRRLTDPLRRTARTAEDVGRGDFDARAQLSGIAEIDVVVRALNSGAEQIGAMLARERRLSADVSHQLRTPISGLRLLLENSDPDLGLRGRELSQARAAVDALTETVEEVIGLARDLPTVDHVPVDDLLERVRERWHGLLSTLTRPLRVEPGSARDVDIAIAPAAAHQILDVLLDNATTHGTGAVSVSVRRRGEFVSIEVSDEGVTLQRESHELFAGTRCADGHGRGLRFARDLAETADARVVLMATTPPTFALIVRTFTGTDPH